MDMRNDSQSPCSNRYQRGMEQRERNRKRRRNARLKRLLKEAAICIGAAVLTAGGLLYMILNDPYEAPAAPIERTYWNGQQYTQKEYESMMSEREAYLQQEARKTGEIVCTGMTREQMARYLGMNRSALSRLLGAMQREDRIKLRRGDIRLMKYIET